MARAAPAPAVIFRNSRRFRSRFKGFLLSFRNAGSAEFAASLVQTFCLWFGSEIVLRFYTNG